MHERVDGQEIDASTIEHVFREVNQDIVFQ